MKIRLFLLVSITAVAIAVAFSPVGHAQQKQQKLDRVEKLPKGANISALGTFFSTSNKAEFVFDAPLDRVWMAVKITVRAFDKDAGRPVVAIDEQSNRVQNGKIDQMAMKRAGGWGPFVDEFVTEVTQVSDAQTKVTVVRNVMQRETGGAGWGPQKSNGKIEKYILAQIADNLKDLPATAGGVTGTNDANSSGAPQDYTASAPGRYFRKGKPTDYVELGADQKFFVQQDGKGFTGTYKVQGDTVTLILPNGTAGRAQFSGDTMTDTDGIVWVKQAGSGAGPKTAPQLTNDQIMQMVAAKLPDEVIIATIRSSTPKFDLAPDALVKLKQAGVSDAILRAMTDAGSK